MTLTLTMALWGLVSTTLACLIHRYMWVRWVRDMHWPPLVHRLATAFLVVMSAALPAVMALGRKLPSTWGPYFAIPLYMWIGIIFYFLLLMGSADIGRWIAARRRSSTSVHPDPEARRRFIGRAVGGGVGLLSSSLASAAFLEAKAGPTIERVEVPLARFPKALSGLKIVQISDLHVGPTIDKAYVENVVRLAMECQPDLIAVTGDLVDGTVEGLRDAVAPLAGLKAPLGTYYVSGNHEYYSGIEPWLAHVSSLGMEVLANAHKLISVNGALFYIAGIHDYSAGRFGHVSDIDLALKESDASIPTLLLAHQPRSILDLKHPQVCLQLSGHTHAGQIWPFTYLVQLVQPYVQGLHAHGDCMIYVNRGTGYWGPPMRLPQRSEITELTLRGQA